MSYSHTEEDTDFRSKIFVVKQICNEHIKRTKRKERYEEQCKRIIASDYVAYKVMNKIWKYDSNT